MQLEGKLEAGCTTDRSLVHLVDGDGMPIRIFASVNHTDDASRLVRIWNCHEESVELVEDYREHIDAVMGCMEPGCTGHVETGKELARIDAVLAKARED